MKTAFIRKYISTVCTAALVAGLSLPLAAANSGPSSIEINLDVLEKAPKPTVPAKKEAAKPAPVKKKPTAEKIEKIEKPKKSTAKSADPETESKHIVKPTSSEPKAAPAPAVATPTVTETKPAELPPIKDLPPELTPALPEENTPSALPVPVPADPAKELPAPVPAPAVVPATPAVPAVTELPKTPEAVLPSTPLPTSAAPEVPTKPGLGDQLSDFINGKSSDTTPTPPPLPPTKPVAPVSETPPSAMGSPLPDAHLTSATPPATAAAAEKKPAAPATPKEWIRPAADPSAPMEVEAPPALPVLTPAHPDLPTKPTSENSPPELPKPAAETSLPSVSPTDETPASSRQPEPKAETPTLPPLGAITGEDVPTTNTGSEPKESELALPDESNLLPAKTAEIPDLVPLPEDTKGDLPALPSGNQEDLLSSPKSSSAENKALLEELSKKSSTNEPDMRLMFSESETDVSPSLYGQLDTLAAKLAQSPSARVNIFSYAGGKNESGIYPKRVSLARGIAVRNYLTTTKGIDIERVNVRALGNKSEGAAPDRIDMFIIK